MLPKTISLRRKFIIGLVLFASALGVCISVIMYFHYNSIMASEISQRTKMVLAQSDAVQDYVKTVLRPKMFDTLDPGRFILQAMSSSYISRQVMARLNVHDASGYHYRRVSKKPRNPESQPDDFEAGLIKQFDRDKTLAFLEDTTMVNGREYHFIARPVTFTSSCMQCHGEPADAPKELIEIYGDTKGFYYQENEVGGVVVAGFPVDLIKGPARELTLQYLSLYLLGIICFAGLISLFFDRLVMKNLHHLARIFRTRFSGKEEQSIIDRLSQKDEIEGLVEGVDELAVCLSNARHELEGYALNLEHRVEKRTRALDRKARKHLGDARLFVDLLSGFGRSRDIRELICALLESIGKRYGADQAIYYCVVASDNTYTWKPCSPPPPLDRTVKELLWQDDILLRDRQLYIPVKSQESHLGILSLSWNRTPDPDDLDPAILLAMGQQLAILIENIHAFSNIRLQHDMLQSVFRGISDPLLLIDEDCHIIIANAGSRLILPQKNKKAREAALGEFLCAATEKGKTCNILDQVVKTDQPVNDEIKTADNRFFDVDLYPLGEQTGMRMVLYAREVTQEKEMEHRMQQAERLSAIGKMAAGIAHEINNPLGVIQVYADLVKDGIEDPELARDLDVILKHTKTAQNVVRNLLNLSRAPKTISGACDLNQVISSELDMFQTQAKSGRIRVTTDLAPDLPQIICDPGIADQILANLWLNAVDALGEAGDRIHIATRVSGSSEVCLTFEDNGSGISDETLPHIFDPFYTTKEVGRGTGLGLSVVYGFVSELGGRIEVENRPQTRFHIFFNTRGDTLPGPVQGETP